MYSWLQGDELLPRPRGTLSSDTWMGLLSKFIRRMIPIDQKAMDYYRDDKPLIMGPSDEIQFYRAMKCRFCHGTFEYYPLENGEEPRYKGKVRDHDHLT